MNNEKHALTYSVEEFNQKLQSATKITVLQHTAADNTTRHGSYVAFNKGLSNQIVFVGIDLITNKHIIEVVG